MFGSQYPKTPKFVPLNDASGIALMTGVLNVLSSSITNAARKITANGVAGLNMMAAEAARLSCRYRPLASESIRVVESSFRNPEIDLQRDVIEASSSMARVELEFGRRAFWRSWIESRRRASSCCVRSAAANLPSPLAFACGQCRLRA